MPIKHTLDCEKCGYSVKSALGLDICFGVAINTFICTTCNQLNDLRIEGLYPAGTTPKVNQLAKGQVCEHCGKSMFILWDSKKKPCPKCNQIMQVKFTPGINSN